jgi:hypothetical protein
MLVDSPTMSRSAPPAEARMSLPQVVIARATAGAAVLVALAGCATDPSGPSSREAAATAGRILTTFDQLTVAAGAGSTFRASVVGSGAREAAGLAFVSRSTAVATVRSSGGRARVLGVAAGRTWIVVEGGAAGRDSVEVIVE